CGAFDSAGNGAEHQQFAGMATAREGRYETDLNLPQRIEGLRPLLKILEGADFRRGQGEEAIDAVVEFLLAGGDGAGEAAVFAAPIAEGALPVGAFGHGNVG